MVSIIPGMLNFAPERTDTRSGDSPPPNVFPVAASTHSGPVSLMMNRCLPKITPDPIR